VPNNYSRKLFGYTDKTSVQWLAVKGGLSVQFW